jgi:Ca2+-binding EF-hand superfamily protein
MEKGVGFLTVKDIISQMPANFGISLKREDFLRLFKEIDSDKDGLVRLKEFEDFYHRDYLMILKNIEKEKEQMSIQFEVFDHLMKVLQQKSLTL